MLGARQVHVPIDAAGPAVCRPGDGVLPRAVRPDVVGPAIEIVGKRILGLHVCLRGLGALPLPDLEGVAPAGGGAVVLHKEHRAVGLLGDGDLQAGEVLPLPGGIPGGEHGLLHAIGVQSRLTVGVAVLPDVVGVALLALQVLPGGEEELPLAPAGQGAEEVQAGALGRQGHAEHCRRGQGGKPAQSPPEPEGTALRTDLLGKDVPVPGAEGRLRRRGVEGRQVRDLLLQGVQTGGRDIRVKVGLLRLVQPVGQGFHQGLRLQRGQLFLVHARSPPFSVL